MLALLLRIAAFCIVVRAALLALLLRIAAFCIVVRVSLSTRLSARLGVHCRPGAYCR